MWKRKRWEGEGVEGGKAGRREEGKKRKQLEVSKENKHHEIITKREWNQQETEAGLEGG